MQKLQTVLRTDKHLEGEPYNKDGSDTYQMVPWKKDYKLNFINFLRISGDTKLTRIELWDRHAVDPSANQIASITVEFREIISGGLPDNLHNYEKDRIFLRLVALDGEQPNHAHMVIKGEEINP